MDKKDTGKDKLKKALKVLKFEEIKESKTGTYYSEGCKPVRISSTFFRQFANSF